MPVCPHCGEKTIGRKHFSWFWMIGLSLFGLLPGGLYVLRWSDGADGRMGIDPDEIAGYTEVILKMSSAWGVSADAASDAIGKIGAAVKPADIVTLDDGEKIDISSPAPFGFVGPVTAGTDPATRRRW